MQYDNNITKNGLEWAERELLKKPNINPYVGLLKTVRELLALHDFAEHENINLEHKCYFWENNNFCGCGAEYKGPNPYSGEK